MIRLVLIDDHRMFIAGLMEIFASRPDLQVVGQAPDGESGLAVVREQRPDVAVLDMTMPGIGGVECARRLVESFPETKILALSMHNDLRFISELLRIGAKGYLLKDCATDELLTAVRTVAEGRLYLAGGVVQLLVEDYLRLKRAVHDGPARSMVLSEREKSVLALMAQGLTSKAIGDELGISKNTVDTHRRRMMDKLGCNSVAELLRHAYREELLDLS